MTRVHARRSGATSGRLRHARAGNRIDAGATASPIGAPSDDAVEVDVSTHSGADDARLVAAVRADLASFYWNSRFLAPAGNLAAGLSFVLLAGASVQPNVLAWWLAAIVCVATLLFLLLQRTERMLHRTRPTVSRSALVVHAVSGLAWGAVPWLPTDGVVPEYRWIALCFMFAVSAGAASGITGMTDLTTAVLLSMWVPGIAAFVVDGELVLAAACAVFLGLVLNDSRSTGRLLLELIRLRVSSSTAAETAVWEATHDPLTGLPNRLGLQELADAALARGDRRVTAMFVDLDHFKEVNDRFGHPVGDELLVQVGFRLREEVRDGDIVGRLGGDEFLIVMLREPDDESAARIAQRLIRRLEDPFEIGGESVYVSASIGVTRLDGSEVTNGHSRIDVVQLVQESDKALYEAKRNGRRQAVVFDAELRAQLTERSGLELALRRAVREDEIEAWGQPVYDLRTGEVAWVELLARWEATPGSFVPPSLFVPLAEEIGVIDDLGRRMLRHATEALARWQDHEVLRNAAVAVNVSAVHIMRDDLVADVGSLVACHGLAASRLIVELTESHRLADVDHVSATFVALAGMGVRLAVDDFGTGYSSLGQLLALPVSIVKIDRSLTSGCERDEHRAGVVRAIRQLAASLGHVVVAEGVETEGERAAVARIGLDQAQGYLLCPPLPLTQLEDHLRRESEGIVMTPARDAVKPSRSGTDR